MTFAAHVTLAPRWLDPAETEGEQAVDRVEAGPERFGDTTVTPVSIPNFWAAAARSSWRSASGPPVARRPARCAG